MLDEILCLVQDKQTWNKEEKWKEEYKSWLHLLLQLVDMMHHPNPEILLDLFIHGNYSACQKHKDYLRLVVSITNLEHTCIFER